MNLKRRVWPHVHNTRQTTRFSPFLKDANIRKSIDERRKFITTNTGSLYLTERESDISGSKSEDYKMIGLFSYSAERKKGHIAECLGKYRQSCNLTYSPRMRLASPLTSLWSVFIFLLSG